MLSLDLFRSMFVATITGVICVNRGMAGLAGDLSLTSVIEGECVALKLRRGPGKRGMAKSTLKTKEACMDLGLSMAAYTFTRYPFPQVVLMTGHTFDLGMAAIQDEKLVMVEIAHPINAIVAIQTGCTELRDMRIHENSILPCVAIETNADLELIQAVRMTGRAGDWRVAIICLMSGKAEVRLVSVIELLLIEQGRAPGGGVVAAGAIQGEKPGMSCRLLMAIDAFSRDAFKPSGCMTGSTARFLMFS